MLCRISGYTFVEALVNLRCAPTALPEYWPLARPRTPDEKCRNRGALFASAAGKTAALRGVDETRNPFPHPSIESADHLRWA
jgi:hypothetical protein